MDRFLVIGYGSMGKRHAANLRALRPNVDIVAADPDPNSGANVADWQSLTKPFFGAIIASPHEMHPAQMQGLALAGIPFLAEKPLAPCGGMAYCERAVSQAAGAPCAVGFNYRYHPEAVASIPVWRAGGRADFVATDNLQRRYGQTVAETMVSHAFDMALQAFGPARQVDIISDGVALTGTIVHENGRSSYNYDMAADRRLSVVHGRASTRWLTPHEPAYRDELADWLTWLETGHRPERLATLADGLAVQAIMEQIRDE